jgi:hypothetical protein
MPHLHQSPVARSSFASPRNTAEDDRCDGGRELCGLFCRLTEKAIFAIAVDKRETRDVAVRSIESFRAGVGRFCEGREPLRGFSDICFGEGLSMIPTSDGRRIARGSKREVKRSTNSVTWRLDATAVVRGWPSGIADIGGELLGGGETWLILAKRGSSTSPTASDRM